MAAAVKFIHCADLHLGSAFLGLGRDLPELAGRLAEAPFAAFARIVDLALREEVDFLVIAGDIFDRDNPSLSGRMRFREELLRLDAAKIPVFLSGGNHDPVPAAWPPAVSLPGNTRLFSADTVEFFPVERNGEVIARVGGLSHSRLRQTDNLVERFAAPPGGPFTVGVLHANVGAQPGFQPYAPAAVADLAGRGVDYWALGHIHDRREVCREPLAAYPGCTQGLHINEPGEKGCLLVTAEARPDGGYAVRTSFRPLGPAVWKTLDMDLGGAASLDELENRLRTGLDRAAAEVWSGCEMLLVRLRLQGRTELDGLLRKGTTCAELADRLREDGSGVPRIWIKDIDVATRPCVERGALLEREDLLGEVFRLSEAARTAWSGCLEALLREWESARAENAEVVRLRARSEEQAVEVREAEAVHHDAVREVERLLNMAQVPDAEAFYRRHGAKLEREALERRREDLEDALRLAARDLYGADADIPAFFASFGEADKEVLEAELAGLAGRLSMLADEEERLADSLRTQEVRLEQAEGSETLSRLRLRAASLSGTIRGLGLEWSRYALARHLLLEARGRFEKERQPGVIRAASALFSAITGGAWVGIAASLEDSSLRVLPPHGEPVSPEVLSRGTQEQLYLALRLAHIRNHAAQAAALPVIMDDVLVNFDPDRALRTAQTFGDLASSQEGSPGHQLLYFTCHPHMADMLRKAVPGVGLYVMERGTIREEE